MLASRHYKAKVNLPYINTTRTSKYAILVLAGYGGKQPETLDAIINSSLRLSVKHETLIKQNMSSQHI